MRFGNLIAFQAHNLCGCVSSFFMCKFGTVLQKSEFLKATAAVNFGHGPYNKGNRFLTIRQAAERIMANANDDYLWGLTERVAWDRGWANDGRCLTWNEFMESRAVQRRLPYVAQLYKRVEDLNRKNGMNQYVWIPLGCLTKP